MTAMTIDDRGQTTIAPRTVERIATAVLAEVDGVGGAARRVLKVAVGNDDADGDARVTARIHGDETTLDVSLSVSYPAPVTATTEAARTRLRERVGELTGLVVSRVDISVAALYTEADNRRRVR